MASTAVGGTGCFRVHTVRQVVLVTFLFRRAVYRRCFRTPPVAHSGGLSSQNEIALATRRNCWRCFIVMRPCFERMCAAKSRCALNFRGGSQLVHRSRRGSIVSDEDGGCCSCTGVMLAGWLVRFPPQSVLEVACQLRPF